MKRLLVLIALCALLAGGNAFASVINFQGAVDVVETVGGQPSNYLTIVEKNLNFNLECPYEYCRSGHENTVYDTEAGVKLFSVSRSANLPGSTADVSGQLLVTLLFTNPNFGTDPVALGTFSIDFRSNHEDKVEIDMPTSTPTFAFSLPGYNSDGLVRIDWENCDSFWTGDSDTLTADFKLLACPTPAPVPEPASLVLLGTGIMGIGIISFRRKK